MIHVVDWYQPSKWSNIKNIPTQLCKSPLQLYQYLQKCLIYFIVVKGGSNKVPTILCVYYMQLEVLDTWSETRLLWASSSGVCETSPRIRAVWSAPLLFAFWKFSYERLLLVKFQFSSLPLSSWGDWFESRFGGNPEDRCSRVAAHMMVVFHGIWCNCCLYIRNVQHHIETAILNAARKEILVFHNREQLHVRLRQACNFETKRRVWSRSKLFGT